MPLNEHFVNDAQKRESVGNHTSGLTIIPGRDLSFDEEVVATDHDSTLSNRYITLLEYIDGANETGGGDMPTIFEDTITFPET